MKIDHYRCPTLFLFSESSIGKVEMRNRLDPLIWG